MATFTVGYTTTPTAGAGNNYTSNFNFANGPYTVPQDGIIQSCSVWLDTGPPSGTMQIGIYAWISNTQPGALLAKTATFSAAAGWNTVNTTTNVNVQGNTKIWMGAVDTVSDLTKADANSGFSLYSNAGGTSTLDSTFKNPATLQASNFQLGAYATFLVPTPTLIAAPSLPSPIASNYRSSLAATTSPVCPLLRGSAGVSDTGGPAVKRTTGRWTAVMSTSQPVKPPTVPVPYVPTLIQAPCSDMPIRPDYSRALASTTQPVVPMAFRTAITPSTYFFPRIEERPLVADVIGRALSATTSPVQPRAPPPAGILQFDASLQRDRPNYADYSRALGATTSPVAPIFVPVVIPPPIFFAPDCSLPLVADRWRALGSTTQPICPTAATIRLKHLTDGSNFPSANVSTASISPDPNWLVIVSVTGGSGNGQVPTVTGAGGTWVLIGSQFDNVGGRGVHFFRDLSPSPGSGALTIDFNSVSQNFIAWSVDEFQGTDLSGTHGSGAIVQFAGTGTGSITSTGITVTLAAFGSPNNSAYGYVRNNAPAAIIPGTGFTELSNRLVDETEGEWALNQNVVTWTWASQTNVGVAQAIEIKAAVQPTAPTVRTPDPLRPDYSRATIATTSPVAPQFITPPTATPSVMSEVALQDDRPMRPDYSRALAPYPTLLLGPVPPAQTPTFLFQSLLDDRPQTRDYSRAIASTTSPITPPQAPAPAQTPNFYFPLATEQLPLRPDYRVALGSTTYPVIGLAFRTAVTPATYSPLFIADDRPGRADYSRALITGPAFVAPATTPTPTPSVSSDLSLQDDRAMARDYRVALASTTTPVAPIFIPPIVPIQNLIGAPDSQLPRRSDYSRALAPTVLFINPPPAVCFNVGYPTIPTLGSGNSYSAGYDFANGPYTMPQTGIVTSCSVWLDTGPIAPFQIGIYDSISASQPGNLLAVTNQFTPAAGWNTQPVTFPTTVAGGTVIFMGALNAGGSSPTKGDTTVGINLYGNNGSSSTMDPVFLNPANLDATNFQLGAYATFCPTAPLTSNWFQAPSQPLPIARDYRVALGDTTKPTAVLSAPLPALAALTPTYLGIAISGEVPTRGDYSVALGSTTRPQSSVYAPPIAFPNQLFLNSLGVQTHISQGYSEPAYETMISYTGIRVVRDGSSAYNALLTLHNNTVSSSYPGVKALIGGPALPSSLIVPGNTLDAAGALYGFEGPNEPNNGTLVYLGNTGGDGVTWVPVAQYQRDLYWTIQNAGPLARYPVFGVSECGGEFDDVGLQFLYVPDSQRGILGVANVSGTDTLGLANGLDQLGAALSERATYSDYMNIHNYVLGSSDSYVAGRPTLSFSIGGLPGGIDGRSGEYIGTTWAGNFPAYSVVAGATVPFVTTETGADTTGGANLTQDQQGKLYVNIYLAGFQAQMATGQGLAYTGIYEMVDQQGSTDNKGLYTTGNVAKLSATYVHNMTTVLADVGPNPVVRSLDFSVLGETSNCHHFLLQKSDNTFYIVLWGEEIVGGPTHNITVKLASRWNVNVYDVVSGTSPVSTLSAVNSIPLTMQDHAMILQITPLQPDSGGPQTRSTGRRTAVMATSSPTGPELLPAPTPQVLYYPGGIPWSLPIPLNYCTALMSTTSPVGPTLLPTASLFSLSLWVPNPDSTMPDWW